MLNPGTHTTCGRFRTQGQTITTTVHKGIHLFLDHIGIFTDTTGKQICKFNNRDPHFTVAVLAQRMAYICFQPAPNGGLFRKNVIHATDGLKLLCQFTILSWLSGGLLQRAYHQWKLSGNNSYPVVIAIGLQPPRQSSKFEGTQIGLLCLIGGWCCRFSACHFRACHFVRASHFGNSRSFYSCSLT